MRVFVSYTQESTEHRFRVWNLCEKLRNDGIDCVSDHDLFSPAEGWPQWCNNQIQESQFVLVVCTETYKRRHDGKEEPGKGLGATWEGHVITQLLYAAASKNTNFIPVVFYRQYVPLELYGASYYDVITAQGYEGLLRRELSGRVRKIVWAT